MPKRGSSNTTGGIVASAEVTSANHVASLCAFHVCGLCAADMFNGDPETEKGAPTSNQVSDVVPSPHLREDALANVGGLHRRRARTHLRRFLLGATPFQPSSVTPRFHRPRNGGRGVRPTSPGSLTAAQPPPATLPAFSWLPPTFSESFALMPVA